MLTRLLERRFGELPAWAQAHIRKADDGQLDAWADALFDARSLDEVFAGQTSRPD
jgi:hypothetical protein